MFESEFLNKIKTSLVKLFDECDVSDGFVRFLVDENGNYPKKIYL